MHWTCSKKRLIGSRIYSLLADFLLPAEMKRKGKGTDNPSSKLPTTQTKLIADLLYLVRWAAQAPVLWLAPTQSQLQNWTLSCCSGFLKNLWNNSRCLRKRSTENPLRMLLSPPLPQTLCEHNFIFPHGWAKQPANCVTWMLYFSTTGSVTPALY